MPVVLKYLLLVITGLLLIIICSLVQQVPAAESGEYYFSGFLKKNYTILIAVIFL